MGKRKIDTSEIPELGNDFFLNAILTNPGENLINSIKLLIKCPECGDDELIARISKGKVISYICQNCRFYFKK